MILRLSLVLWMLAGCATAPEQPQLKTYGNLLPVCLIFCDARTTLAETAKGATTNLSNTETTTGGARTNNGSK